MRLRGLYLLADESVLPWARWPELMPAILDAGPVLVQYRAKGQPPAVRSEHAGRLRAWCAERGLPLLINDDPALACTVGAQGVHLGRGDAAVRQARAALGPAALIGSSCYDELARARAAIAAGADYVSFGRLYPSATKPQAPPAALATLRQARARLDVPICAIGGIHAGNAREVLEHGADLLCVAGGILAAEDPVAAARKLATICRF